MKCPDERGDLTSLLHHEFIQNNFKKAINTEFIQKIVDEIEKDER
jgi:hypothetical protein